MSNNRYILIIGEPQYDTKCFITEAPNLPMAINNYYADCGYSKNGKNDIFYKMCSNPDIFTIQDIMEYVNKFDFDYEDRIKEIYLLGEKVYG